MVYQIALSPELGLSDENFVTAWNEEAEAHEIGVAHLPETKHGTIYNLPWLDGTIVILSGIGLNIASSVIYDLVKKILLKKNIRKHTRMTQIDQPDGTHILLVDIDEE